MVLTNFVPNVTEFNLASGCFGKSFFISFMQSLCSKVPSGIALIMASARDAFSASSLGVSVCGIAAVAAEGYARTSDKVGFVNLHTGCGVASLLGMLFNAHRGGVPLVVTAGQVDSRLLLRDPHLSGQLVKMTSPLTKWSAEVLYPADIPVVM